MRWGVRRFQPYPSGYKGDGKEVGEAKTKKARIGWDDDVIVKKGTKAYRVSVNKTDTDDRRYLTVDENDRNFYKGMWPSAIKGKAGIAGKDTTVYEQKYRLNEDLISPSAAKRQKMAADLASSDRGKDEIALAYAVTNLSDSCNITVSKAKTLIKGWAEKGDKAFAKNLKDLRKDISKDIDDGDEKTKAMIFFNAMGSSDTVKSMYCESFVKQHYNMVIDDHGADFVGKNKKVNAPIIVLKANKSLEQIGSKPISDYQSNFAINKYFHDISTISGTSAEKNYVPNVVKEAKGKDRYYS